MTKKEKQTAVTILSNYMLDYLQAARAGDDAAADKAMDRVKRYRDALQRMYEIRWELGLSDDYTRDVLQAAHEISGLAYEIAREEMNKAAA